MDISEAQKLVRRLANQPIDCRALAELCRVKTIRKFDEFVSEDLLTEAMAADFLDAKTAMKVLQRAVS